MTLAQPHKTPPRGRLPPWLKKRLPAGSGISEVAQIIADLHLATVCDGAHCPNRAECYARRTATFMILGETCTRTCGFCAVAAGAPAPVRDEEAGAVAEAAARLGLRHVVITSVTRDDLPDGGAGHFARTIRAVRDRLGDAVIEVLTPDFAGRAESVDTVLAARPDIFNHNVETPERLYPRVRPQANYARSLAVLRRAAQATPRVHTKSGFMVGLGETDAEIRGVLRDLRGVGCDIVTIGQYLAPSPQHLPVVRFVEPAEFDAWRAEAKSMGFAAVAAAPFVRSSYHAEDVFRGRTGPCGMTGGNTHS